MRSENEGMALAMMIALVIFGAGALLLIYMGSGIDRRCVVSTYRFCVDQTESVDCVAEAHKVCGVRP